MSEARTIQKTVTMIPPTVKMTARMPAYRPPARKVAAYARVSTDSEEQLTSYEAQVSHYTHYIQSHAQENNWEFVDVYTDRGVTGTSMKKREGFNRMVDDALAGKIDLIITKSVSRFARNTVDTLTTIRELKAKGVEVYFEEQNISTLDGKGELLLTIMSSIAQEESRSISENVTWGMRKRFADGKVSMPYGQFMGYRQGEDGQPEIVEEEADIVRTIFRRFLEGFSASMIARQFNDAGIPSPSEKYRLKKKAPVQEACEKTDSAVRRRRWSVSTVESILTNEKYKGDAILQKTYCTDFLSKVFVANTGEVIPRYYVKNSHPAIVSEEVFDLTQIEFRRRKALKGRYSGNGCFASRVVCADCGGFFGSKVWHSNDSYRRVIWRCNQKYGKPVGKGADQPGTEGTKCSTPHVTQEALEAAFMNVLHRVLSERDDVIDACRTAIGIVMNTEKLEKNAMQLQDQMVGLNERIKALIEQNARVRREQADYQREYEELASECEKLSARLQVIEDERRDKADRARQIELFLRTVEVQKDAGAIRFAPSLVIALVEKITVHRDGRMVFLLRSGVEMTV